MWTNDIPESNDTRRNTRSRSQGRKSKAPKTPRSKDKPANTPKISRSPSGGVFMEVLCPLTPSQIETIRSTGLSRMQMERALSFVDSSGD